MNKAIVNRHMLTWARERSGFSVPEFAKKCGVNEDRISAWESGERQPTFQQAMTFAEKAHVPFGYLFLSNPPIESLQIPDLRTVNGHQLNRPSPELIELLKMMLECQDWYRTYAKQQLIGNRSPAPR